MRSRGLAAAAAFVFAMVYPSSIKADCCCIEVVSCVSMLVTLAPAVEETIQNVKQQDQIFLANKRREELAVNMARLKKIRMKSAELIKEQSSLISDLFPTGSYGIMMVEAETDEMAAIIENLKYVRMGQKRTEDEIGSMEVER